MSTQPVLRRVSAVKKYLTLAVLAAVVGVLVFSSGAVAATPIVLDWEQDANGNPLLRGQFVANTTLFHNFGGSGVDVDISVVSAHNTAIIFDSNIPGPDPDLGTPNETCTPPGPGVGEGGEVGQPGENCVPQNNLLIIPQNIRDDNGDGLVDVPDDDFRGGLITITFSQPVVVEYVEIMDQESTEGVDIITYADLAGTTVITSDSPSGLGDNSFEFISINAANVMRLDFDFAGSGAVAAIAYTPPGTTAVTLNGFSTSPAASSDAFIWAAILLLSVSTVGVLLRRRAGAVVD